MLQAIIDADCLDEKYALIAEALGDTETARAIRAARKARLARTPARDAELDDMLGLTPSTLRLPSRPCALEGVRLLSAMAHRHTPSGFLAEGVEVLPRHARARVCLLLENRRLSHWRPPFLGQSKTPRGDASLAALLAGYPFCRHRDDGWLGSLLAMRAGSARALMLCYPRGEFAGRGTGKGRRRCSIQYRHPARSGIGLTMPAAAFPRQSWAAPGQQLFGRVSL
jgi:hypothetical protein